MHIFYRGEGFFFAFSSILIIQHGAVSLCRGLPQHFTWVQTFEDLNLFHQVS